MRRPPDPPESPADDLRHALRHHGRVSGYRWRAKVQLASASGAEQSAPLQTILKLTATDTAVLAALIRADADRHKAAQDPWLGTAEIAEELGVKQGTIRGWVSRGLPKENPFPPPNRKNLSRSRWRKSVIDAWRARQGQSEPKERGDG